MPAPYEEILKKQEQDRREVEAKAKRGQEAQKRRAAEQRRQKENKER